MFFNDWLDILLFKKKPADIAKTSIGTGLKNLVIASVIVGILSGILQYLAMSQILEGFGGSELAPFIAEISSTMAVSSMIWTMFLIPIGTIIGILIVGAILHLFCLIVGGKGNISNYIGALAMVEAAIMGTATLLLTIIGIIGAAAGAYLTVSMVIGLIGLLVSLWQLVLIVLVTQAVQQLSLGRAIIAVIVIPVIIAIVLSLVLAASILALILGATGATGLAGLQL